MDNTTKDVFEKVLSSGEGRQIYDQILTIVSNSKDQDLDQISQTIDKNHSYINEQLHELVTEIFDREQMFPLFQYPFPECLTKNQQSTLTFN